MKNGTFRTVKKTSVRKGTMIYGTMFVDSFKTVDYIINLKSRLIAQNYLGEDSTEISTKAPAILTSSQMLIC